MVIFALPGNDFSKEFFQNWIQFMFFLKENRIDYMISIEGGSNVSVVREKCLGLKDDDVVSTDHFDPFYSQVKYDHIMWIDSDIYFSGKDFLQLMSRKVDIVSGLYKKNSAVYAMTKVEAVQGGDLMCMTPEEATGTDLIEAAGVGMGFCLIKRGVFEKMPRPWFLTSVLEINGHPKLVSEDVYFCLKAREAGFKVWIDPTVKVGHIKRRFL
jgi:hypothetical protein